MSPRSIRRTQLPPMETDDDNVVRQEQAQGTVRPDGPGDETAPVERERSTPPTPRHRGIPLKAPRRTTGAQRSKPATATERDASKQPTKRTPTPPAKAPNRRTAATTPTPKPKPKPARKSKPTSSARARARG